MPIPVLERDALLRIMLAILADPKRVIAVGGIIRVLKIADGNISHVRLPRKSIEIIQVIEYLRAFLIDREAWGQGNMLTIISGAFGVFRTDLVRAIGGYRANAIGEDCDLVARLHQHLLDKNANYRIHFVLDPMCWTEVPSDLKSLGRQRARWQKGLFADAGYAVSSALRPDRFFSHSPICGSLSLARPYWKSLESSRL
jgi:cellulose synthase/poly-beta-1,6-N-acetylglucosamine synthase-like glycosyltransferase